MTEYLIELTRLGQAPKIKCGRFIFLRIDRFAFPGAKLDRDPLALHLNYDPDAEKRDLAILTQEEFNAINEEVFEAVIETRKASRYAIGIRVTGFESVSTKKTLADCPGLKKAHAAKKKKAAAKKVADVKRSTGGRYAARRSSGGTSTVLVADQPIDGGVGGEE